jgi:nitrate/nitrite-specific signal transduction histidine kinase
VDAGAGQDRLLRRSAPERGRGDRLFILAERLTNVAQHARPGHAEVTARIEDGTLAVQMHDDGVGDARPEGSGLV